MSTFTPPPPASLNGGLYTGEPFAKGAPWANVPVLPDSGVYSFTNLPTSAPRLAKYMLPGGGIRPGNSTPLIPSEFSSQRVKHMNAICIPATPLPPAGDACLGEAYRGYGYLL